VFSFLCRAENFHLCHAVNATVIPVTVRTGSANKGATIP